MECRLYLEDAPSGADYAPDETVDLGSNWEAINFLLTGEREGDGSVGGLLVEEWSDLDGSEAALIDAASLRSFNTWLMAQLDDAVLARFDPVRMAAAGVYRAEWLQADPAGSREILANNLISLRAFAAHGAEIGSAAIRVIV